MYFGFENHTRPSRLSPNKDAKYHTDYAKYCLGTLGNSLYRKYISKSLVNWSFYQGGDGQWIFEEDTEAFFLDESGDFKNRIKWTKNVLKPMVQQYIGNAIRLNYDAKATCISDFVINKREDEKNRMLFLHKVANSDPYLNQVIRDRFPIGDTELETEEKVENTFVNRYEQDINNLLEFISTEININEIKVQLARNLAICGVGVYKGNESCNNYRGESKNPMFFFWDMSAIKPDLSDSEYMGEWYYMDAPSIYEQYEHLTDAQRQAIEGYTTGQSSSIHRYVNGIFTEMGGKVPVYEVYWKDCEKQEYGYVLDEFGYPYYTQINGDSKYTDKDLITPPTDEHKAEMGDKKKHVIYVDILRFCTIISQLDIANDGGDIVLDYGIVPYQNKNGYDPANVKFPYSCYTWAYDRGMVMTPLDDAIDPQRFLNRTISVIESHLSNMRGTGTVISKSAIDERDGEGDLRRNINASKPIIVDTDRVGSVQNAVGTYGSNIGSSTLQMFEVINQLQTSIQDVTGVNEAMTGTQGGSDVLVGVVDAQIQRGSLVQEPFYYALSSILRQAYEDMATVGKAVYIDNPRRLAMMVGDRGVTDITLTRDHMLMDFRIKIDRGETREQGIQSGNALLFTLLQAQLIDQERFSNLFNRTNPEMIADALREYSREKKQAEIEMDKVNAIRNQQNAQAQANATQLLLDQSEEDKADQVIQGEVEHNRKMEEIAYKENAKNQRELADNGNIS